MEAGVYRSMSDAGEEDGETIVLTRATAGYQQSASNHAHADQKHKLYGRRWAMLALYTALAATNQLQWITFGPISSVCQDFYGVSALQINMVRVCCPAFSISALAQMISSSNSSSR